MTESRAASHFQRLYQSNPDPWGFTTSRYEQTKYRATVRALEDRRHRSGLEVGCSIGILTRMLAPCCDSLLGLDIVDNPLVEARARCADQPHVAFQRMQVPAEWPPGRFDLIVFSEMLYFLSSADIEKAARLTCDSLIPGGTVLLVHWLGETDDPNSGEAAPIRFIAAARSLVAVRQHHDEHYRLDLLRSA